jgi:hypothetical protein
MNHFSRAGVAGAVLAVLGLPALAQDDPRPQGQQGQQGQPQPQPQQPQPQPQQQQQHQGSATKATLDEIRDNPQQYAGMTVRVTGKVDDILGPHLFTVDSGKLIDFGPDTVVILPAPLAALVTEDTPVEITGTVEPLVESRLQEQWGIFRNDPELIAEIRQRSGIVAQSITTTRDGGMALTIDLTNPAARGTAQTDLNQLARADESMIGQRVELANARVESVAEDGGFWVSAGDQRLFVLPEPTGGAKVAPGQTVRVEGVVLPLPEMMKDRLGSMAKGEDIYVYTRSVRPAAT